MQKLAWFRLSIVALTLLMIFSLVPFIGYRSVGGLGFLGLLGIEPFFFRQVPGQVISDERDVLIQQRSWIIAYTVFWLVFVLVAVVLSAVVYGEEGTVPVYIVRMSVLFALMLVYTIASIATLVQYAGGTKDVG